MARTKEECLRAAAHALVVAVIRIEQDRLDMDHVSPSVRIAA
jgi:hypothetical protein